MLVYEIIRKKRDGEGLSREEINFLVQGFTRGEIPDYQMAAWLMAAFLRGLDPAEVGYLTRAMVESGECLDLSGLPGTVVDKHSTGGVGDTTTLVLAPLVAAAGLTVAKMAGRGLGHTGGTLDKLESIPGFRTSLTPEEFISALRRVGVAITGQTPQLVPADGRIYALRDVTATVDSIPLIAASVMSKKIAAGARALVLDVKAGDGAFTRDVDSARELARLMLGIAKDSGIRAVAVISSMNQPLGRAVGNALEVEEAVETLRGQGPPDLVELCLSLGAYLLRLAGVEESWERGRERLLALLNNGVAREKFCQMIEEQGGDPGVVEDPGRLPRARLRYPLIAASEGFVASIDALGVGRAVLELGGGRKRKLDPVDPAVGVVLHRKVGERVKGGDILATIHANREEQGTVALRLMERAYRLSPVAPPGEGHPVLEVIW